MIDSKVTTGDLRSQSLDLLRFPLAVVVVTVHLFTLEGIKISGNSLDVTDSAFFLNITLFVRAFFSGISVPVYFFIAGYVFFFNIDKFSKIEYGQKIRNRVKSLLIPYVVWNALEILLIVIKSLPVFNDFVNDVGAELTLSLKSILSCFWLYQGELFPDLMIADAPAIYPLVYPLWFLRDLMIVVIFTPILYFALRQIKYFALVVLFILYITPVSLIGERFHFLSTAFLFFSIGAYMSIFRMDIFKMFSPFFLPTIILFPLLGFTYIYSNRLETASYIKMASAFVALPLTYNLAAWLLRKSYIKVSSFLAAASFFIYVSHELVCFRILKVIFVLVKPDGDLCIIMVYLLAEIFTILLLLFVFYTLKRYTPSLLKVVAGRK